MTEPFWKATHWLPVILLIFGLVWVGCRSVEPVYQNVPASSDAREADSHTAARVYDVGGEVRTPGPKAYFGKTAVSMSIQAAGDFTKFANKKKAALIQPNDHRESVNVVKAATNPSLDLPVYPGDAIFVKQRGYWFQKVPSERWKGSSEADH